MVSRIKYDSFPKINRSTIKGRILVLIFLVLAIILVFITDGSALFFIFISYVLIGIFRWIFYLIFSHKQNEEVNIKEETN